MKLISATILLAVTLSGCGIAMMQEQERQRQEALQAVQEAIQQVRARCAKAGHAAFGMRPDQVIASEWGRPSEVNTSIGSWGKKEQWVYKDGPQCSEVSKRGYLYFQNGQLTSASY
jgi:hypothetical protein